MINGTNSKIVLGGCAAGVHLKSNPETPAFRYMFSIGMASLWCGPIKTIDSIVEFGSVRWNGTAPF